jgi:hypothetical protein
LTPISSPANRGASDRGFADAARFRDRSASLFWPVDDGRHHSDSFAV